MALEADIGGGDALELFAVLARANRVLYGSLSVASRQTGFTHTELGKLTVDWVIYQQAGHLVHHWKQLEALALNA
jgi:hypothetical protein